jgi:hypothetical protein
MNHFINSILFYFSKLPQHRVHAEIGELKQIESFYKFYL